MENRIANLRVQVLQLCEKVGGSSSVSVMFVWTLLPLSLIMMSLGIGADVSFVAETERSDNGQRHLLHAQLGRHGREMTLEDKVHQGGMNDVVLMVTKGYLGTSKSLGGIEQLLATLPRA